MPSPSASSQVAPYPPRANAYKRDLIANAHFVWGLNAPIAAFAGQIHQESAWQPDAKSIYAGGLAQFTPDTAEWISGKYPDLATNQPFEPAWALRALTRYDKELYLRYQDSKDTCNQWAFTLSAYNGGAGWVNRDKDLAFSNKVDDTTWFGAVERYSKRSAAAIKENRNYPKRILYDLQPLYITWGPQVPCKAL